MCGTEVPAAATSLGACYAMSGTEALAAGCSDPSCFGVLLNDIADRLPYGAVREVRRRGGGP
eukprot:696225-Rhodomonas_salina.1